MSAVRIVNADDAIGVKCRTQRTLVRPPQILCTTNITGALYTPQTCLAIPAYYWCPHFTQKLKICSCENTMLAIKGLKFYKVECVN